jgi:hypothetical protein
MKKKRETYESRATLFAKACDIGYEVLRKAEIPEDEKQRELKIILADKNLALNPLPQFKKMQSLKCIEAEHFWYWNEKSGVHINLYWKAISQAGLPFKRKDVILSVLKRKRVKDIYEFDFLKDELLSAEQTGRVTMEQAEIIKKFMEKFEFKNQ